MSEDVRFDDRVVIVTGAGNGIGRGVAVALARAGAAAVVLNDLPSAQAAVAETAAAIKELGSTTSFALADVSSLGVDDDLAFCERMIRELGVAAIPTSPFHHDRRSGPIRFAFCKSEDVIRTALDRLQNVGSILP